MKILTILLIVLTIPFEAGKTSIGFPSGDGVEITADLYMPHDESAPFIVLFHQAGWSRGAYIEIAPKLNRNGFNCMAVDLRSGGEVNGILNETHLHAAKAGLPVNYTDAYPDMEAAVDFARKNYAKGQLIIWGSSYSASLVLKYAGEHQDVDGVLAFSPGEYFTRLGKPADYIKQAASKIEIPVFITSARNEKENWFPIYKAIPSPAKTYFRPETRGNHGSRALWSKFDDSEAYWKAVKSFLNRYKK